MLVASLTDLIPVDYRVAFSQTSFPISGPSDEFLSEMGYAKVNVFRPHNQRSEKLIPCQPIYEEPWVYTVEVVPKTVEEIEAETQSEALKVRDTRNKLLASCDWTQLADVSLSIEQKENWNIYRQALRDVPDQAGFPWDVQWPLSPNDASIGN